MAHEWQAGVLSRSSWHGQETIGVLPDAAALIAAGESSGAWPVRIDGAPIQTADGLIAPGKAIVGTFLDGSRRAVGVVSKGYTHTKPEEWRSLVKAAVEAGAKPTGAFSLRGGSRIVATFDAPQPAGTTAVLSFRDQVVIADSFDRTTSLMVGTSTIRVVCANTLSAFMGAEAESMGRAHHNSGLPANVVRLEAALDSAVREGSTVRELYGAARERRLSKAERRAVLEALFPVPAKPADGASPGTRAAYTRAVNARDGVDLAAARSENADGDDSLATLWNAATWLVDRDAQGEARKSTSALDSMLFGTRGARVRQIRNVVQVVLRNGEFGEMEVPEAVAAGVSEEQIGRQLLADMLEDAAA